MQEYQFVIEFIALSLPGFSPFIYNWFSNPDKFFFFSISLFQPYDQWLWLSSIGLAIATTSNRSPIFYLLPLLYTLHAVVRMIFHKDRTSLRHVQGLSWHKEHTWYHVAFTILFSLAWMMSRASSPSAFLSLISYILLSPDYLSHFSLPSCPIKVLPILQDQSERCFFRMPFLILLEFTVTFFVLLKLLIVPSCAWQNNVPNNAHVLILRTCDYVILYGKRNFADVINLRILKWKNYPRLSKWAPYNWKGPYKREAGVWKGEKMLYVWL